MFSTSVTIRNHAIFKCAVALLVWLVIAATCYAQSGIPGFTEATEKVEVAAVETGLLAKLNVEEGDFVDANAVIGQLDNEIQQAQMEIAKHLCSSKGEFNRVTSELRTKESILEHFKRLESGGFVQQKEILRAEMEVDVAKAIVLARQEKTIENEKKLALTKIQLDRREIRTPIAGQVSQIHRKEGEFVSVTSPTVITVVKANPISAKFQIPITDVGQYPEGKSVTVVVGNEKYKAKVESVGVVATSETVQIRVAVSNEQYEIKIGQKCQLLPPSVGQLTSHSN